MDVSVKRKLTVFPFSANPLCWKLARPAFGRFPVECA